MSTKLIKRFDNATKTAKVYRDTVLGEFSVQFFENGIRQLNADYFTDEKDDAMQTAQVQIGLEVSR